MAIDLHSPYLKNVGDRRAPDAVDFQEEHIGGIGIGCMLRWTSRAAVLCDLIM